MKTILFHGGELIPGPPNSYVGSPLYDVIPEHETAVLMVLLLVGGTWWMRRRSRKGKAWAVRWIDRYRALPIMQRFLAWLLAISTAVHFGLLIGHEPSGYTYTYAAGTVGLGWVTWLLLTGRSWKRWTRLVLVGSIVGYAISSMAGNAPDQVGIATKLVELTALTIAAAPAAEKRLRAGLATAGVTFLFVLTAFSGWVGAFAGTGGHHLGDRPAPGVLLPTGEDREPTAAEQHAADELYEETVAALAKYADPAVAAADGYNVDGMWGRDFHAENPAYQHDGHILDPHRPETLVYAVEDGEPVLLGAMFTMPEMGQAGPAIGGPLTVWHAHDHICLSLIPIAIAGVQSPFGTCPIGSITIPETGEMIHIWTVPGAPEPYGDLDDAWLDGYLGGLASG